MSPLLALVCPCFRKNVLVTSKIVSFLHSLHNFFPKMKLFSFFGNQILKWHSFETRAILTYFSHFLVTREKTQKFLQHISHLETCTYFAHPNIAFFCLTSFAKIMNLSCMVSLWCDSWC